MACTRKRRRPQLETPGTVVLPTETPAPVPVSFDFDTVDLDGNAVNTREFAAEHELTLVNFWATWCGPCKTMAPIVEEIAEERTDIKVCKIDVDQEPELARQYRVMSIPTFLVFKDGEVVKRDMGVMSKDELEGLIV